MSEERPPIRITQWLGLQNRRSDLEIPLGASPDLSNIEFFRDGWKVRDGFSKVNTTTVGANSINGLYDGFNHRLLASDTKIYKWDGASDYAAIAGATGLTNNAVVLFTDFNGLDIMVNGSGNDAPKSWDGTTFQTLHASAPKGGCIATFNQRVFIGGLASPNEDRVEMSKFEDGATWEGRFVGLSKRQKGHTVIGLHPLPVPNDSRGVLGILADDAIYHYSGFTSAQQELQPVNTQLGLISARGVGVAEGISYLVDENGIYASGDGFRTVNNISWDIQPKFDALNKSRLSLCIAQNFRYKRQMWFVFSNTTSTTHNIVFVYNYGLSTPLVPPVSPNARHVWSIYEGINVNSMAEIESSGEYVVHGGNSGTTGFVYKLDDPDTSNDADTAITWNLKTGRFLLRNSFSLPAIMRRLSFIHDELATDMSVDLFLDMDRTATVTGTINLGGASAVFGTGTFGTAAWAGGVSKQSDEWYNQKAYAIQFKFSGADKDRLVKCYEIIIESILKERAA